MLIKWILFFFMIIHGLIHLMGGLSELGMARIQGISGRTIVDLSRGLRLACGVAWMLAVILFLAASLGLLLHAGWWRPSAFTAISLSQLLIIVWWPDAKWGTLANILIITGLLYFK